MQAFDAVFQHRYRNVFEKDQHISRLVKTMVFAAASIATMAVVLAVFLKINVTVSARNGNVRPYQADTPSEAFDGAVSVELAGRVSEIFVTEGQEVVAGQVLARLDTRVIDIELQQSAQRIESISSDVRELKSSLSILEKEAETSIAVEQAELARIRAQVARDREQRALAVSQARSKVERAQNDADRIDDLFQDGAATEQQLADAHRKLNAVQDTLQNASLQVCDLPVDVQVARLELLEQQNVLQLHELRRELQQRRLSLDVTELDRRKLQLIRDSADIVSPVDGVISRQNLHVGMMVAPGEIELCVASTTGYQLELDVAGRDVAHIRTGMPATVELAPYPRNEYGTVTGVVSSVSRDSRVVPSSDGTETVYTLKIRLLHDEFGSLGRRGKVGLGMQGAAEVSVAQKSALTLLWDRLVDSFSSDQFSL